MASVLRAALVHRAVALVARRLVVLVQVGLEREALVAALAGVVLEGRVRLHVGAQVGAVGKRLAAVGAGERLLARVRAHVALQQPRPAERLAAHAALVPQVVGEHVHGERGHGHIHLVARGTLPGLLAVQAAVRLLVAAQVRRGGVGLAALAARVLPLGLERGAASGTGLLLLGVLIRLAAGFRMRTWLQLGLAAAAGSSVRNEKGVCVAASYLAVQREAAAAIGVQGGAGDRAVRVLHVVVGEVLPAAAPSHTPPPRGVGDPRGGEAGRPLLRGRLL